MFRFIEKHVAIRKAETCKGWTSSQMLGQLYDLAQSVESIEGDILEIGSAWGRSAILFLLASSKDLYSIDPHTGGRAFIERNENQNSLEAFKSNIAKFNFTNRVHNFVNTTQEVADKDALRNKTFAFVFIDGLHSAEGVKIDFDFTFPLLAKGGLMAFDDYFSSNIPDYTAMIDTLCRENQLALIRDTNTKLVYLKK